MTLKVMQKPEKSKPQRVVDGLDFGLELASFLGEIEEQIALLGKPFPIRKAGGSEQDQSAIGVCVACDGSHAVFIHYGNHADTGEFFWAKLDTRSGLRDVESGQSWYYTDRGGLWMRSNLTKNQEKLSEWFWFKYLYQSVRSEKSKRHRKSSGDDDGAMGTPAMRPSVCKVPNKLLDELGM